MFAPLTAEASACLAENEGAAARSAMNVSGEMELQVAHQDDAREIWIAGLVEEDPGGAWEAGRPLSKADSDRY